MQRNDAVLKHRYTCWMTQDAYAEQDVWARTLTYDDIELAVTETGHLKYYNLFITGPKNTWVAFEVSTGFPLAYGTDPDYTVEAAKRLIAARRMNLIKAIDAVKEIYGIANEQ
jgi:hypothetical protein